MCWPLKLCVMLCTLFSGKAHEEDGPICTGESCLNLLQRKIEAEKELELMLEDDIGPLDERIRSIGEGNVDNSYVLDAPSCEAELQMKDSFSAFMKTYLPKRAKNKESEYGRKLAPNLIRAVFHDSVDKNNLQQLNQSTGKWDDLVSPTNEDYGGVDGCLYSGLDKDGETHRPDPGHNRNLGAAATIATKFCERICTEPPEHTTAFLKGENGLCKSLARCAVDAMVLGAITSIEGAGGPKVPMTWGRTKGDCGRMVVTPFDAGCRLGKCEHYVDFPALGFAPPKGHISDPQLFRDIFQRLGFNATEQAALMGAHTFGKGSSRACNALLHGPLCNKMDKWTPRLTEKNFEPNCIPVYGEIKNCWRVADCGRTVCNGDVSSLGKTRFSPLHQKEQEGEIKAGFTYNGGMGAFFDRTPEKFDNDYYKMFATNDYELKETCCGNRRKDGQCTHLGSMQNRNTSEKVEGGACAVDWCRSDRKEWEHMKATHASGESHPDFVKQGSVRTRRIVRFSGDWVLLGLDETKAAVKRFADDQDSFFEAFAAAFEKVTRKGTIDVKTCVVGQ